ncbi:inner membrane CreD family protein [Bacillus sp. SIMBA_154]|uniref:inner membrane CreD family protein n=1 Tax=Bacillus sp. SIMBA_154 TaxID=3080859 RepID=UPI00397D764A
MLFLYSLLYGLLSAEDYALLMGSVLVFVVLSLIRMLTRRVNWYGRQAQDDETN